MGEEGQGCAGVGGAAGCRVDGLGASRTDPTASRGGRRQGHDRRAQDAGRVREKSSDLVRERKAVIFAAIADWADSGSYPVAFMCEHLGVSRSGYYAWRAGGPSQRSKDDTTPHCDHKAVACRRPRQSRCPADAGGSGRGRAPVVPQARPPAHARRWSAWTPSEGVEAHHNPRRGAGRCAGPDRSLVHRRTPEPEVVRRHHLRQDVGRLGVRGDVIDLHSRAVVGYAIDHHMRTSLVTDALDMAIATRQPAAGVIFHSDRGTQYTSADFDTYCRAHNIRRSLGRTGICYDNAVSESTFATYKKELIHTRPWPDLKTLRTATIDWIENYFNPIRRHSTLGYLTPREYELGFREISQLVA